MRLRYKAVIFVALLWMLTLLVVCISVTFVAVVRGRVSKCPRCGSERIRPALPRAIERFLPQFVLAQRCESCANRFYSGFSVDYTKRHTATPRGITHSPGAGA